jgi:hypothetical protein
LLVSAILVAVCTASLPQNDVQHLTDEIRQAENNLNGMMALENQEEAQMKAVGNSIEGLPNVGADNNDQQTQRLVQQSADQVLKMVMESSQEESGQEAKATAALTEVSQAVQELEQKNVLGEGAGETPVQHAIAKLKQVKSTLTRGTATMHTKERLDRMANEAQAVKEYATRQPSSTQQQMSGGALSALKQLQPSLGESKEEGAISALQRANTPTTPTNGVTSKVQQETQDLAKLLKQEKSVYAAEEADKSEIGSLIKNLD